MVVPHLHPGTIIPLLVVCCLAKLHSCDSTLTKFDKSLGPTLSAAKPNDKIVLNTLEDVEMLTFFLLWKHDFYEKLSFISQNDDNPNTLTESKLRQFIEMLKLNNLINVHSEFNVSKTCEEDTFRQLSAWWPSKSLSHVKDICEAANSCKNAKQLFQLLELTTPTLSQSISRLCPLMLFQLQEKECVQQRELSFKAQNRPSWLAIVGYGFIFVTIVSFCSLAAVVMFPFVSHQSFEVVLNVFQGLAVGSLCGSAIFHLIPQAFNLIQPGSNHDYLWRALIIFSGIYLFFWSERLMKIVSELRNKKKIKQKCIPSSTSIDNEVCKLRQVCFDQTETLTMTGIAHTENGDALTGNGTSHISLGDHADDGDDDGDMADRNAVRRSRTDSSFLNWKRDAGSAHNHGEVATVAWMIILGDGLHNFIDGIAIGAAFSHSILEGISISVAVICEEFPHELGDFAILIGSGIDFRTALLYNFASACTCYIGFFVGVFIGDFSDATPYVFALAGGMFLYISLVDIMGELSNKLEQAAKKNMKTTATILLLQNIGILLGVGVMFSLAKYSDKINFEGLVPPSTRDMPFTKT